jgi:hypothetical protein
MKIVTVGFLGSCGERLQILIIGFTGGSDVFSSGEFSFDGDCFSTSRSPLNKEVGGDIMNQPRRRVYSNITRGIQKIKSIVRIVANATFDRWTISRTKNFKGWN